MMKEKMPNKRIRVKKVIRAAAGTKVFIPRLVLKKTTEFLQQLGDMRKEGMVFWGGVEVPNGPIFVTTCLIPQISRTSSVSVHIHMHEGAKVVSEARKRGMEIVAQVHSHPGEAFHSSTDDEHAFAYNRRFLSIVVPNFGRNGMEPLTKCCIMEYKGCGKWHKHSTEEIAESFTIFDFEVVI